MWYKNCDKFFSNKKTAKVNLYKISGSSYVKIKLPLPFVIQHKIHKSNIKVSPYYWIICFYSRNICHDIFVTYELCCLFFLFDVLNSKIIEICHVITIYIQNYPMSCYYLHLLKFILYALSFVLGYLFLE